MNEIEKKLFKDQQSAIDYLIGDNTAYPEQFKELMKLAPEQSIIDKANSELIADNIGIYVDLFLKLLYMSDEIAHVFIYDTNKIYMYKVFHAATLEDIPKLESNIETGTNVWLFIHQMKNKQLFELIKDFYSYPNKIYSGDLGSIWIELCPTTTTKYLDILARMMCKFC